MAGIVEELEYATTNNTLSSKIQVIICGSGQQPGSDDDLTNRGEDMPVHRTRDNQHAHKDDDRGLHRGQTLKFEEIAMARSAGIIDQREK